MVERAEDGQLRPYVMDFGLARSFTGAEGATETGAVLGTPHFMAPEQARGEVHRLDRRVDVYSLGATLYCLLTGEVPVPGDNLLEVLSRIEKVEPRPPRAIDPDIPADLEAIALRCLEKDRSARYDSARALAEDLDRFLRGDPVLARPTGLGYRLRKRLAKHRRLVIAVTAAAALLLSALGWGISKSREAATRERLARRFTELVERIESQARYSSLSRLHDIRGDRAALRAQMAELAGEIKKGGPLAVGPGHYALGRGHLALGEDTRARELLESAWQHGYHAPREAYALSLALGHLYQEQLREVEWIEQKDRREERRREIEQRYRDPALAYLKQSAGAEVPSTAYVAALVAFYEGRLDDALRELDAVGSGLPWFWEAPALRGDVLKARAVRRWNDGGDREGALADFEAGRQAYAAAAAVGESVPSVHQALGALEYAALWMELYGQGNVKPRFEAGEQAVHRALAALPDDTTAHLLEARLLRRHAEYLADQGGDVDDLLVRAIAAAEAAVAAEPERILARVELGRIHYQRGSVRQERNLDPREDLQKAIDLFAGIDAAHRDYEVYLYQGLVFQTWADYEDQVGMDSLPNRGKTIDTYLAATRLDARQVPAWINLGATYFTRASSPHDKDPDGDLEQARTALDKARALNPKHVVPYYYGGKVRGLMADRKRAHGADPRPDLEAALESYRQGLVINPTMWHLHAGMGEVFGNLAHDTWDRGQSPHALLEQALAAHRQAIATAPNQGLAHHNLAGVLLLRGELEHQGGEDPTPSLLAAVKAFQRAVELTPEHPTVWANLGEAYALLAREDLAGRRDPQARLALAQAALGKALQLNPGEARAHSLLGEARGVQARLVGRKAWADFEAAAAEMAKAIDLSPDDHELRLALGRFSGDVAAWRKAEGLDPGPWLKRGLERADQVLAVRPDWPDARVLRASLLLAQAQVADSPKEPAVRAVADFTRALEANPHLKRAWAQQAALARRLSTGSR